MEGSVIDTIAASATVANFSEPSLDSSSSSAVSEVEDNHKAARPPIASNLPERDADLPLPEHDEAMAYWCNVVHEQLLLQMDLRRKDVNRMSDEQLREESAFIISEIVASLSSQLPSSLDTDLLHQNVLNEAVGLGPLELFLADESITEIMVNNHREIFVEKQGRLLRSPMQFSSDATVYAVIERIITPLGRRIDESSPIVDARLKDGSRVNAVIPPLALKGPSLTIRKFPKHRMQFSELVDYGTLNEAMVSFLRVCVERRKNIIVSGGTGSGKTTLLNVLSNFIPDTDRIVTIEDAAELSLHQPNLVSLESRPANLDDKGEIPIRDLVRNSLRMRPDRIVVGECRGGEALDMLQAMNTGHDGSLTTIHANTPRDVLSRLEVLVLMAGMDLPVTAIREQVSAAVDIIIQQQRFTCGSRKITRITEVAGMESGTVQLQDIFRYEQHGVDADNRVAGDFVATGSVPNFYETLRDFGVELDLSCFANGATHVDAMEHHDSNLRSVTQRTQYRRQLVSTQVITVLLFIACTVGAYLVLGAGSAGLAIYRKRTSELMQTQLTGLFLFNDARKLSVVYLVALAGVPVLVYLAGFGPLIMASVFLSLLVLPRLMFSQLRRRRAKAINLALPDALAQLASAMRAGATFTVAMQGLVEEDSGPLGEEFSLLLREHRIGARMEDALDNLAERVRSEEMDLVVSAVLIAQDVGGNLSEILQGLSITIRRKLVMEGKIEALTSQGMMQGYVVSALPFALLGALSFIEPEATLPIFNGLIGWIALGCMATLQFAGAFMIKKIVTIEI